MDFKTIFIDGVIGCSDEAFKIIGKIMAKRYWSSISLFDDLDISWIGKPTIKELAEKALSILEEAPKDSIVFNGSIYYILARLPPNGNVYHELEERIKKISLDDSIHIILDTTDTRGSFNRAKNKYNKLLSEEFMRIHMGYRGALTRFKLPHTHRLILESSSEDIKSLKAVYELIKKEVLSNDASVMPIMF